MKLEIEFNDKDKSKIKKSFFEKIFLKTLEESGVDFLHTKNVSLSLAIVGKDEIQNLNRIYRKKNSATDVLSFSEFKNRKELEKVGDKDVFLGEIILCYNDITEYSKKKKKNLSTELAEVSSHGLLHLLGFRHGKKMFEIQKKVSKNIKN